MDDFIIDIARSTTPSKNIQLGGRDGFKTFSHGITNWIRKKRRIDGGWHIAMARQLRLFFCTTALLTPELQIQIGEAYDLLMKVHTAVRIAVPKNSLPVYQAVINDLLDAMVNCRAVCPPHPLPLQNTRRELGCSAAEKSLERKLGETQKRNFKFTNGRNDVEVPR